MSRRKTITIFGISLDFWLLLLFILLIGGWLYFKLRNERLNRKTKIDIIIYGLLSIGILVVESHLMLYFGYYLATGTTLEDMFELLKSHSLFIVLSGLVTILLTLDHFQSYIDGKVMED